MLRIGCTLNVISKFSTLAFHWCNLLQYREVGMNFSLHQTMNRRRIRFSQISVGCIWSNWNNHSHFPSVPLIQTLSTLSVKPPTTMTDDAHYLCNEYFGKTKKNGHFSKFIDLYLFIFSANAKNWHWSANRSSVQWVYFLVRYRNSCIISVQNKS